MPTLLLFITAPMQSWGYKSRFDIRDTSPEPTRSGIIGLICCAMGIPRGDKKERDFDSLRMGVRIDVEGFVRTDYQTVMEICTADNKSKMDAQTWRDYLENARFLVGLEHESEEFLRDIEENFKKPIWSIYLGRKSYVPSLPLILPGGSLRRKPLELALKEEPWYSLYDGEKEPKDPLRIMIEPGKGEEGIYEYGDFPLDYSKRKFTLRKINADWLHEYKSGGVIPCIFQE